VGATDLAFTDSSDRLSPSGPNCHSVMRDTVRLRAIPRNIIIERRREERLRRPLSQGAGDIGQDSLAGLQWETDSRVGRVCLPEPRPPISSARFNHRSPR